MPVLSCLALLCFSKETWPPGVSRPSLGSATLPRTLKQDSTKGPLLDPRGEQGLGEEVSLLSSQARGVAVAERGVTEIPPHHLSALMW